MLTSDFDYVLPRELIAQEPLRDRDQARMMFLPADGGETRHMTVACLPGLLKAGDLLIVNDTRVVPARLFGRRPDTGGSVELLIVEELPGGEWDAFVKCSGRKRECLRFDVAGGRLCGEVTGPSAAGRFRVRFCGGVDVRKVMEEHGVPPLPPYIKRIAAGRDARSDSDRAAYQTMFARESGAVAAPTAGLHFTPRLAAELTGRGVGIASVTLHVGPGTFKPVSSDDVEGHAMESERFAVPQQTADAVRKARSEGGRVVAVGTTVVRTLETVAATHGSVVEAAGRTSLFIRPPYRFAAVDGLLTNFHLPRSTLLMLVSAFAGRERVMAAYSEAVRLGYRFYSYGDCMVIL
jgi:S-adenosylmethionine:tRNA ribosyltransferase-isomerase